MLVILLLCSCSPRIIESIRTEYVYRDSLITKDTTIYVHLPVEVKEVVVYPTDSSMLETSLAESSAWVDSVGLHHTLRNKDRDWGVTLPQVTRIVSTASETAQIRTIVQKVEKPLPLGKKVRLWAFLPLLVLALVGWRKEILKLIRKIAGL